MNKSTFPFVATWSFIWGIAIIITVLTTTYTIKIHKTPEIAQGDSLKITTEQSTTRDIHETVEIIKAGDKDKKLIALTFDDGPHPRFTLEILDILNEYNAKATFFVLGENIQLYPDILRRVYRDGHEVGNHTFSHLDIRKGYYEEIKEELESTQRIIYETIGIRPVLFRPPFGLLTEDILRVIGENGGRVILWNQDPNDWRGLRYEDVASNVIDEVDNGNIILLHDYVFERESQTVEALKIIMPELIKQGYEFVTITELLGTSCCYDYHYYKDR